MQSLDRLAGFLGSGLSHTIRLPEGARYCHASAQRVDLPALRLPLRFNALFRQCAVLALLRRRFTLYIG